MNSERWSQIRDLFDASVSLPPSERADWLRNACGDDESLRADVEHLLAHDMRSRPRRISLRFLSWTNRAYGTRVIGRRAATDSPMLTANHPRRQLDTVGRPHRMLLAEGGYRLGSSGSDRTRRPVRSSSRDCASCRSFTSSSSA